MEPADEFIVADALAYEPHQLKNAEYVAHLIAGYDDKEGTRC